MAQITVVQFRTNFPEFAYKRGQFPDSSITFWLAVGYLRLNARRWVSLLDLGVQLYVAHNIVLEKQAADAAKRGGSPGQSTGPVNSKSVDKVSVGYDTAAAILEGAGNYNLTTYGTRFYELMLMAGAGPVQIGPGGCGVPVYPFYGIPFIC